MEGYLDKIFFDRSTFYQSSMIGILLITVGIIFLFNPINLNFKFSASLMLIGFLFIFFFNINEKSIPRTITGRHFTVIITLWVCLMLVITINIDADIFVIIVIMGVLAIKVFSDEFVGSLLKKRMNILFYFLLIIFAIIIGQRLINFLGI